jgi:predicted DNA-binding WGR domain protein
MTKQEEMQAFVRYYKRENKKTAVTMAEIAAAAIRMGWKAPAPITAEERLAKQFAAAEREEMLVDKKTKRPYRANLSYSLPNEQGEQTSFWVETDDATRNEAEMWMVKYREQMLGEAVIGTDTIEHWNRINPKEDPLQFKLDFTDEAEWRRNVPVEEEEMV